jgi:hypothetical protein
MFRSDACGGNTRRASRHTDQGTDFSFSQEAARAGRRSFQMALSFASALSAFFFLVVLLFFFFVFFGDSSTQDVGSDQPLNMVTLRHVLHYKSKTIGTGPIFCSITGAFDSRPLNFRFCDKPLKAALKKKQNVQGRAGRLFAGAFATDLYHKDVKGAHAVSDGPQEKLDDHSRTLHQTAG